jgi:hypothetical protein
MNNINENIEDIEAKIKKKRTTQVFKSKVPVELLWDFLKANFEFKDTHYLVNKFLYKKVEYNKNILLFTSSLKEYYHKSKRKYIERTMNYNFFLTILRQLCNSQEIKYTTKLVYDKSSYEIEYYIHF